MTIATLLSTGLSIAQDMGMHQMSADPTWAAASTELVPTERTASLIAREVQKRVFYSLIREDWFAIPYRRSYGTPTSFDVQS
jgi:hypothetical protein